MLNSYKTLINGIAAAVNSLKAEIARISNKVDKVAEPDGKTIIKDASGKLRATNNSTMFVNFDLGYTGSGKVSCDHSFDAIYKAAVSGKAVFAYANTWLVGYNTQFSLSMYHEDGLFFTASRYDGLIIVLTYDKNGNIGFETGGMPDSDNLSKGYFAFCNNTDRKLGYSSFEGALGLMATAQEGRVLQLVHIPKNVSGDLGVYKWGMVDLPEVTPTLSAESTDAQAASAKAVYDAIQAATSKILAAMPKMLMVRIVIRSNINDAESTHNATEILQALKSGVAVYVLIRWENVTSAEYAHDSTGTISYARTDTIRQRDEVIIWANTDYDMFTTIAIYTDASGTNIDRSHTQMILHDMNWRDYINRDEIISMAEDGVCEDSYGFPTGDSVWRAIQDALGS